MAVGMIANLACEDRKRPNAVMMKIAKRRFGDVSLRPVVGPFIAFFRAHGWSLLVMLAAISLYRIPDFMMGPMANPYTTLGLKRSRRLEPCAARSGSSLRLQASRRADTAR